MISFSRSPRMDAPPRHPLPATDDETWRRFLRTADLYVTREDTAASKNEEIVGDVLKALDRMRPVMSEEPYHSMGSTVMKLHEEHALVHHHMEAGSNTTVHLDVVVGGVHNQLELTIPRQLGPWTLMAPEDGSTDAEMATAMRRIHEVMTTQLRRYSKQRRERLREAQDRNRRKAMVEAYARPILHEMDPRRRVMDLPTPWGGAVVPQVSDHAANARIREALAETPVAHGTRLAVEIRHFAAADGRGPINNISMKPMREVVDAVTSDPMESLRAAMRLGSMPPLAPLFETSETGPIAPDPR